MRINPAVVAIVGRPNVGKSTLFNRLIRSKKAIVDSTPGVTRDRNYGDVSWQGNRFRLIDTGGIGYPADSSMLNSIRKQAESAISEADLILFLCDGKQGLLWEDREVARLLLKTRKNTLLVVNKIDDLAGNEICLVEPLLADFYKLGMGEPIPISAAHGLNVDTLLDKILTLILSYQPGYEKEGIREIVPISVAIVGKPNVGKSSILNAILGQERVIVDNLPGTTRDAIDTLFEKGDNDASLTQFLFIDTAGIRKKNKVTESLEYYSVLKAIKSIERASVVLLVIDAIEKISTQDKKIVAYMEKTGCAGIIIVNKWDLVLAKRQASVKPALLMDEYKEYIQDKIPYLSHFPIMFTSTLTKEGINRLLSLIEKVSKEHKKWVSTSTLNAVIKLVYSQRKPPSSKGKGLKIYYATQVKTSPPTFLLFVNHPTAISTSYMKYLQNRIRAELKLSATPIQIKLRQRPR
ncbi:MAG: ribosome biogenesis GTPase Der [bacterium]|nr:ribosome biogenesis GTPase Der [bacterium]